MNIYELPGLKEVEIGKDRIVALKGRCKAKDFKEANKHE